jgi:hypothetical protein
MKNIFKAMLLVAGLGMAAASGAAVINGQIRTIDGNGDGLAAEIKISRVTFSVTAGTHVFFDSLVRESTNVDLNGDGYITGFDNYMMLFDATSVLVADDDSGATFADGSVHRYDSTLDYLFSDAGTYTVTLGQLGYNEASARQGFDASRTYLAYDGNENFGAWRLTTTATGGTLSDLREIGAAAPNDVPEPAGLALLGAGFLGFVASRRKSAKRKQAIAA